MATAAPADLPHHHRLVTLVSAICALALIFVGLLHVQPAHAAPTLERLFNAKTTGTITITGNALSECNPALSSCAQAQKRQGSMVANNFFSAQPIDKDNDPSTANSSSATVTIPNGGKVLAAYLFWSATQARSDDSKTIKFKAPGGSYRVLSPDSRSGTLVGVSFNAFTAFADVTSIVAAAGSGAYWGADVTTRYNATDQYAGWALIVVIEDTSMPMRDLSVYQGSVAIKSGQVETSISGFLTPKSGDVRAKVGSVIWEGDQAYSGDWLQMDNTRLGDALNPTNNFFSGVVSRDGQYVTDRDPNTLTTMAVDAKVVDATGVLRNGQNSTTVTFGTNGDVYYVNALTTEIDLYVPDVTPMKSVVNVSAGERGDAAGAPARVGDILEYTVTLLNKGQDTALRVVMSDKIPAYTEYVANSLSLVQGDQVTRLTDQTGDDAGDFTNNTIVVRAGGGATPSDGGSLKFKETTTARFRVKLTKDSAGKQISNEAKVTYTGETDGGKSSRGSNAIATPVAEAADLSVTKTGPQRINAGESIEWTISVHNDGPSSAEGTKLVDTLPAEVTNVRILAPASGCSIASGVLTCELGSLPATESREVRLAADLPAGAKSDLSALLNQASVSSTTSDPVAENNYATAQTQVGRSADVSMTKKIVGDPNPVPGQQVSFELTVKNSGPSTAEDLTVTDTLPPGLVLTGAVTTTAGTCSVREERVMCALGDLRVGEVATIRVTATVPDDWTNTAPLTNTAAVQSSRTPDPDTSNNSSSVNVVPQEPQADLIVNKTMDSGEVVPGRHITYNVHLTNAGPSWARGVVLKDILPVGLTLESVSTASNDCTSDKNTVQCTYDRLAVGSEKSITIVALVDPSATGELTNTATVTSKTKDPHSDNNSSTVVNQIKPQADLKLEKTTPPRVVAAGEEVEFTLTVSNGGPSRAQDIRITDKLAAPLEYVSSSGAGFTCTYESATVTCSKDSLDPQTKASVVVKARIPGDAAVTENTEIVNSATVISSTPDPHEGDNTATVKVPTGTAADLAIAKSGPKQAVAGEQVEWTIDVSNHGPSDAEKVVVSDVLPAQIDPATATVTTTGGPLKCALSDGKVSCTADRFAAHGKSTVIVRGTVGPQVTDVVMTNTAKVTAQTSDPTTSNNVSTLSTDLTRAADLSVTKTGPSKALVGQDIVYTIRLSNDGPSVATDVVVADALPRGVAFITASDPACAGEAGSASMTCKFATLAPGQTREIQVTGHIVAGTSIDTPITNLVTVDSTVPDPNTKNNRAEASTKLEAKAKVVIAKRAQPETFVAGAHAAYFLTVTNAGPSSAKNVVITDEIPQGLTPTSVQGPGTCQIDKQTVTCHLDWVPPTGNDPVEIGIGVDVAPDLEGDTTNTATLKTSTPLDPESVTTAKVTTPIVARADVVVQKSTTATAVVAGAGMTWQLTVVNKGPSIAKDVQIVDTLPEHMSLSQIPQGCTFAADSRTLTCPIGALAAAESKLIEVSVIVDPNFQGTGDNPTLVNHASVTTTTFDPDSSNNQVDRAIPVKQYSQVAISKSPSTSTVSAGNEVEWLITVRNDGPSTAHGTVVTDSVDPALSIKAATFAQGRPCAISGQEIRCELGDVPVGLTTISVITATNPGFEGSTLPNAATLTVGSPSNATPPLTAVAEVGVAHKADLSIAKSAQAVDPAGQPISGDVIAGDKIRYTFIVTNHGPSNSPNTSILDVLPTGLSSVEWDAGAAGTCTLDNHYANPDGTKTSGKFVCKHATSLAANESWTVSLTATVDPAHTGELSNTASVGGRWNDPDGDNNSSTATVTPALKADLAVTKTLESKVTPGKRATWKLHVSNGGPSVARNVSLTDALPEGVSAVQVDSVTPDILGCSVTDRVLRCVSDSLAPHTVIDVVLSGLVDAKAQEELVNVAKITSTTPDPDESNNSSTVGGKPEPETSVHVIKTSSVKLVHPGEEVTWTLTVTNAGPSTARDIAVTDVIDEALQVVSIDSPPGSACKMEQRTLQCLLNAVDAASVMKIKYRTKVLPQAAFGAIANTVSVVTTNGGNGTPSTDMSTTTIDVIPSAPSPTPSSPENPPSPGTPPTQPAIPPSHLGQTGGIGFAVVVLTAILLGGGVALLMTAKKRRQ